MQTAQSSPHRSGVRSASQRRRGSSPNLTHLTPRPFHDPLQRVGRETISWKRKLFHVLGIGAAGFTYAFADVTNLQALMVMGVIALVFCSLDMVRFYVPSLNRRVRRDFGPYMRNYELERLSGSSWFLFGSLITIALFPRTAGALAFIYLAVGDPLASWVGVRWGRIRLPGGKSLEGSLTLFASSALIGFATLLALGQVASSTGVAPITVGQAAGLALVSAFSAAVAEWLPARGLDDNFVVPVVTAGATSLWLALLV